MEMEGFLSIFGPPKMKRVSLTYPVWLILVGGCAVLTFHRINKHNFYHHYYRVIEEVQTRNSQEWLGVSSIHIFSGSFFIQEEEPEYSQAGEVRGSDFLVPIRVTSFQLTGLSSLILPRTIRYLNAHPAQAP